MTRYIIRRLLWAVFVIFATSLVVFFVTYLTGDPVGLLVPPEGTKEDYETLRHVYGFDRPLVVQYADFAARAVRGDFGNSLRHQQPALPMVIERLPNTAQLALAALIVALVGSIPLGIISAVKRRSWIDTSAMTLALLGQCMPTFWLGIMLILVFAVSLRLLPAFGNEGPISLVLPAITLGAYSMARLARLTRSNMLEVLQLDYVRTAYAKGLAGWSVILGHAFKNAAIPIVTLIGLEAGNLLSGAIITETVFAYPGIGLLAVQSVINRDVRLIQAVVFVVATIFVVLNLLADLAYMALDPRIRLAD
jgi:peptide/nickel transport system permease protein